MSPLILILVAGGSVAFLLLVMGVVVSVRNERSLVDERLGRYLQQELAAPSAQKGDKSTPVGDWLNGQLQGSSWGDKVARELARADVKLKPAEYIAVMLLAAIGVGVVAWYVGGRNVIFGGLGGILGIFLPRFYVSRQQTSRLHHFDDQLADMLNLMVNGLRAGYSTMQSMEAVSKEMPSPISDEFRRVVQEMQLGLPMEKALDNLLRRIPSDDLDLVVAAINVQREVGGNLAEILDIISYTIRERVRIKGEIRVLTSQVIYSGRFLAMLPLIIAALLWLINRPYMMQFFNPETRVAGIIALSVGAFMVFMGYMVMTKIAAVDV
jgi:tight adherence protein B